jgi:Flp pilus assembly protein TadG
LSCSSLRCVGQCPGLRRPLRPPRAGAASAYLLILFLPVILGLMGFALDLGRMYLVRGELKAAANAMALAAAQKLIGTDASTDAATSSAHLTLDNSNGSSNKYDFGGLIIGQSNGNLNSDAPDPTFFATVADAKASDGGSGSGQVSGSAAKHARIQITAEEPLTFWSFIPIVTDRKVSITTSAVAGMSAPLCVACGIEPIAIAAVDQTDATDFGFTLASRYTLAYVCNGSPPATGLAGAPSVVSYLLLNRLDLNPAVFTDEQSQLFRIGAQGMPGSTLPSQACFTINNTEQMWASAVPGQCGAASAPASVVSLLCGVTTRFESTLPSQCSAIPEVDTISSIYTPDTDTTDLDDYTQYLGGGRRVITVPIVDALSATGSMTVLGFRQFLIEPNQGGVDITPNDNFGRFVALYIGSVVPVQQGRFAGCQQTAGPGKVVLHQ